MTCAHGHPNPEGARFCNACGATLGASDDLRAAPATIPILDGFKELVPEDLVGGRYLLEEEIGRGAFGVVFRAQDRKERRTVALKFLKFVTGSSDRPSHLARFDKEWQACTRVAHPNIVGVTDQGQFRGQPFLVMQHVEGCTLADEIARANGPMDLDRAVAILEGTLYALNHAHMVGVIHRDVKPSNILLDREGTPLLSDFGIAKLVETVAGSVATQSGILGTPSYMSPEQARGAELDPRSDLFSLGVVAYELVTGRRAYQGHPAVIIHQVLHDPLPPATYPSASIASWIEHACRKSPGERFSTAHEMRWALVEARRAADGATPVHVGATEAPQAIARSKATAATIADVATPPPPRAAASSSSRRAVDYGIDDGPAATAEPPSTSRRALALPVAGAALIALALLVLRGGGGAPPAPPPPEREPPPAIAEPGTTVSSTPAEAMEPIPSTGSSARTASILTLLTTPSGATATVDGTVVGKTPIDVVVEPGASHHVRLGVAGHREYEERGLALSASHEVLRVVLQPLPPPAPPATTPATPPTVLPATPEPPATVAADLPDPGPAPSETLLAASDPVPPLAPVSAPEPTPSAEPGIEAPPDGASSTAAPEPAAAPDPEAVVGSWREERWGFRIQVRPTGDGRFVARSGNMKDACLELGDILAEFQHDGADRGYSGRHLFGCPKRSTKVNDRSASAYMGVDGGYVAELLPDDRLRVIYVDDGGKEFLYRREGDAE